MKYLFILGKNPQLSLAELKSYFAKINNKIKDFELKQNALLLDLEKSIENDILEHLGGTISIGEVISSGNISDIIKELDNKLIYSGVKNKLNYVVWNFSDNHEVIRDYLKKRFKSEKLKSTEKNINDSMQLQSEDMVKTFSSNRLINEEYFLFSFCSGVPKRKDREISSKNLSLFSDLKNTDYFGKIIAKCDYAKIEKRDMEKPVRREALSISPRLAKIMINLSGIKSKETLADPFCGIGVILIEALLQNIQVIGVDCDKVAIDGAKENLNYFGFPSENFKLINNNSERIEVPKAAALVTEPDFGEIRRKIPTKEKAEKIVINFEKLMIRVLNNLKNQISGKFVFTAPTVRIGKKRISCNLQSIANRTGLRLMEGFPIQEFRKNQIVGREIVVLT